MRQNCLNERYCEFYILRATNTLMLRLDDLQIPPPKDSKDLERMVRDLYRAEWSDPFVQHHGRSGQRQHGVDLIGLNAPTTPVAARSQNNRRGQVVAAMTAVCSIIDRSHHWHAACLALNIGSND